MNKRFYLVKNWGTNDPRVELKTPYRILELEDSFSLKPNTIGYLSLRGLRRNSLEWKKLKMENSKMADKICKKEFILKPVEKVLVPISEDFNDFSAIIVQHTFFGKSYGNLSGVHHINDLNRDRIRLIYASEEDDNGVWEGIIEFYSIDKDLWQKKESSFFPNSISSDECVFEIYSAFKSLPKNKQDLDGKYLVYSHNKIPIEFYWKHGKLKSIYPLFNKKNKDGKG